MADFNQIVNTLIPWILVVVVVVFIWKRFGKGLGELIVTIKGWFASKKKPEEQSGYYNTIEYDG